MSRVIVSLIVVFVNVLLFFVILSGSIENSVPLLHSWYTFGHTTAYSELNLQPSFTDEDWRTFAYLKQYNYNTISNLSKDICKNLRDVLYKGINDGLNIDELVQLLLDNGLQPDGKFSAETRARMIAQTEKSRLINRAKIVTYKKNMVEFVNIVTKHDGSVCGDCLSYEQNNPHRLDQVEDLLPLHPHCRCKYQPYIPPTGLNNTNII